MKRAYTLNFGDLFKKYPITSKETGNTYEVTIYPYGMDVERYSEGCIVTLYKKRLFRSNLLQRHFENRNGKIRISYYSRDDVNTEYDYDMVNMAKLIVDLYEENIIRDRKTKSIMVNDYAEFTKWHGEV